jgi:hypothetical protein
VNTWRRLSPPGRAAITVLGLKGAVAGLPLHDARGRPLAWPAPGGVRLVRILREGGVLDEALVVGTGDGAELHLHGGPGVEAAVAEWLAAGGFVPGAAPEPVAPHGLRHARALLSERCGPLADLRRRAAHAAFHGAVTPALRAELQQCLALEHYARRLATPPVVRLIGLPNAGKSTLFNALLGEQRALVSPHAGTTRDSVRARLRLRGVPVELQDTAGGPPASWPVAGADLLVHVRGDDAPGEPEALPPAVASGAVPCLMVPGRSARARAGPGLLHDMAEALALPTDPAADLRAPVSPDLCALFRGVLGHPAAVTATGESAW